MYTEDVLKATMLGKSSPIKGKRHQSHSLPLATSTLQTGSSTGQVGLCQFEGKHDVCK